MTVQGSNTDGSTQHRHHIRKTRREHTRRSRKARWNSHSSSLSDALHTCAETRALTCSQSQKNKQLALNTVTVDVRVFTLPMSSDRRHRYSTSASQVDMTTPPKAYFVHVGSSPATSLDNLPPQRSPRCTRGNPELDCLCSGKSSAVHESA